MRKIFYSRTTILLEVTAVQFIVFALGLCLFDYLGYCNDCAKYAPTIATLAGAILVFSTLEIQSQSLEEEKSKNKITRFDSRFYPILSSFRNDAANVEVIRKYIVNKGIEIGQESQKSFLGDNAFSIAHQIIETAKRGIYEEPFLGYNHEDIQFVLSEISKREEAVEEKCLPNEEFNKVNNDKRDFIHSQQLPYLLYTYSITKDTKEQLSHLDQDETCSILLQKLLEQQPATFSKYIRTLQFIIYIIKQKAPVTEQKDYYHNIYSLLEKNELTFLEEFKEFNCVTREISHDQKNSY